MHASMRFTYVAAAVGMVAIAVLFITPGVFPVNESALFQSPVAPVWGGRDDESHGWPEEAFR
jgi:hypothetical protein